jgi:hypothetical protein
VRISEFLPERAFPDGLAENGERARFRLMRDLLLLAIHLLVILAKLIHRGGVRAVAAESLILKQQIIKPATLFIL